MKLKDILALADKGVIIDNLKKGRKAAAPDVEKYKKELDPEKHDVMDPNKRPDKKVKVGSSDPGGATQITTSGDQSEGSFRTEPVARIALAIQRRIVKSAASFTFGNPVDLIASAENTKEEDVFKSVKKVLYDNKDKSLNKKIARAMFSSTEVAEIWYPVPVDNIRYGFPSKFKLRCAIFNPLDGDKLFPFFDDYGDLVAFSREYATQDDEGKEIKHFEAYMTLDSGAHHYAWTQKDGDWVEKEGFPKKLQIQKLPIIYGRQDFVEWADVQRLIDRLEVLLSNFADTNDYFASPTYFVTGKIIGWAKKGDTGKVMSAEDGAKAQILSWEHAPESTKLEIDTLMKLINTITQTADTSFDAMKDIGAISGVALKLLFTDAHLKVQDKMEIFDEYLQRRLSVIQSFLAEMNKKDSAYAMACESLSITPEIRPYTITDELEQVEIAMMANGQKPFVSQKTTIKNQGWSDDPDAEYEQIKAEESASAYVGITEPTI